MTNTSVRIWSNRLSSARRRSALGAAFVAAIVAALGIVICRTTTDARLRNGVQERAASRWTLETQPLDDVSNVNKTDAVLRSDRKNGADFNQNQFFSNAQTFRSQFEERLAAKATDVLTKRPDADWRAVALGLARWNVDVRTARRVFNSLEPKKRDAASAIFAKNRPFDYPTERADSTESARLAIGVLQSLQNDVSVGDSETDENDESGFDAAVDFLRQFDDEKQTLPLKQINVDFSAQNDVCSNVAPFLWSFDVDSGNPIDSLGILIPSDVGVVQTDAAQIAEQSLKATTCFLFFVLAAFPFGGGWAPGSAVETLGGAAAIRREIDVFFKNLDSVRRRFIAALATTIALLQSVFLAQTVQIRSFGVNSTRILSPFAATLATVRLLN